jgi:hypothetical protein
MTDIPAERPASRRLDLGAADVDAQVDLGWREPDPEPPAGHVSEE